MTHLPRIQQAHAPYARQIARHIRRTVGECTMVFHERLPNGMTLDLHVVPPQGRGVSAEHPFGRDFFTLVTSGMSARGMGTDSARRMRPPMELMISLPRGWKGMRPDGTLDPAAMEMQANWWPIQWLKRVARMPHELDVDLVRGDVLPHEETETTLAADTRLSHLMIGPSRLHPRSQSLMVHDDIAIEFCALWPLHADEAEHRARCGAEGLLAELDREHVTELVDVGRAGALHPVVQRA